MVSRVCWSLTRSLSKVRCPISRISLDTGPKPPVAFSDWYQAKTSCPACFLLSSSFETMVEEKSAIG